MFNIVYSSYKFLVPNSFNISVISRDRFSRYDQWYVCFQQLHLTDIHSCTFGVRLLVLYKRMFLLAGWVIVTGLWVLRPFYSFILLRSVAWSSFVFCAVAILGCFIFRLVFCILEVEVAYIHLYSKVSFEWYFQFTGKSFFFFTISIFKSNLFSKIIFFGVSIQQLIYTSENWKSEPRIFN